MTGICLWYEISYVRESVRHSPKVYTYGYTYRLLAIVTPQQLSFTPVLTVNLLLTVSIYVYCQKRDAL